ncbi:phosphotransferase enzyme family protein [Microlunatus speluncae]|uniref:phosphotransferase enzyme family protein n=1 Tax=Microlunatus speluncae TaxID=2594267 RepID=UPI0012665E22|nr:phosphotransferase [Microlunatus speluncae]
MPLEAWASVLGSDPIVAEPDGRVRQVTAEDGREYVLKRPMVWDPEAPRLRLAREFRILSVLQGARVPVALPVITDDGCICTERDGEFYLLLPRIPFDIDDLEQRPDAREIYRRVGEAIARMLLALADCPYPSGSYEVVLDERVGPAAFPLLRAADPDLARQLDRLSPRLAAATAGLPRQLTHGDCHDGNILIREGHVVGFIDLDHLSTAPRICDVNRWLGNRVLGAMAAPRERWPAFLTMVQALLSGFDAVSRLSRQERDALGPALLINELNAAEWSLGQGDDSSSYVTGLIRTCHWLADRDAQLN